MSYQVLARKWRPKRFQEVIGQSHVTQSLQNAIAKNKIGHAYMLVGTRGVGKTSVARIFAKAIRCENLTADINACGECPACLDFDIETSMNVIEIDGASNNSVDNIRELIGNVHYLPTFGRFKVYIIDEVHMLSTNAFNALLKTLEEPPAHAIFIFATTEAQKLLGTVLSRCQRFDFRNVSLEDLMTHVKGIAKIENIKFENEDLIKQLALLGKGSVRDMLSLLDQVLTFSSDNKIVEETLTNSLGVAGPKSIAAMLGFLFEGKPHNLSGVYNKLLSENVPVKNIASSLLDEIFNNLKKEDGYSSAEKIWVYETIARETGWVFHSIAPEKAFEVLLYKVSLRREFFNQKIVASSKGEVAAPTDPVAVVATAPASPAAPAAQTVPTVPEKVELEIKEAKDVSWEGFLNDLRGRSPASASNLEQGQLLSPLRCAEGVLDVELGFGYSGEVFMDYLKEPEVFQRVLKNLADYFEVDKKDIRFEIKAVSKQEEFISQADIREQKTQAKLEDRVTEFKNNPLLKEAERLFNAKVDKVIMDTKK